MSILAQAASAAAQLSALWEDIQRRGTSADQALNAAGNAGAHERALQDYRSVLSDVQKMAGDIESLAGLIDDAKDAAEELIGNIEDTISEAEDAEFDDGKSARTTQRKRHGIKFADADAKAIVSCTKLIASYLRAKT